MVHLSVAARSESRFIMTYRLGISYPVDFEEVVLDVVFSVCVPL